MRSIGPQELLVLLIMAIMILLPAVFYLLTLRKALERCSTESRTMAPGKVWLMLIPLFNIVWHFLVVTGVSNSLHNEFVKRSLPVSGSAAAKKLGLAMCILMASAIIPVVGLLTWLAGLVCWIVYWVKISILSERLEIQPPPPLPHTAAQ